MGEKVEGKCDITDFRDVTLLYVEDEIDVHEQVMEFLGMYFKTIYSAFNGKDGLALFKKHRPAIVLTDIRMPEMDGLEMAGKVRELSKETPIIIITAHYEADFLMKAIDIGVDKYVRKPTDGEKLLDAICKSALPQLQQLEIQTLSNKINATLESRISKCESMKDVVKNVQKVANSDFSVVIYGETGVGKSYVANIIHDMSPRADKPFITVDIAAIPETLVESELFGHTKGAFTGADKNKKGFFEVASGGTLFLEELENMSPYVQSKLLRAVEEKRIFPVGSTTPVDVDIRLISATNKNIFEEVKNDKFREDLFYRLCEFDIHIPPLRERPEDILEFAVRFVKEVAEELDKNIVEITDDARAVLRDHTWKGNVRELKNVMRRAVLLADGNRVTGEDVLRIVNTGAKGMRNQSAINALDDFSMNSAVIEAEKQALRRALKETGFKKVKAASLLNIDYKTLVSKMEKYNIKK
jgi:DNA-binding NtrC family response regulator